jgi:UDP-N-acetylmuramoyl-L-alanyl-D-glutamate--2,6-diaminopimelate ligase
MAEMNLSRLVAGIPVTGTHGDGDPVIRSLVYDSRRASPGSAFFALPGLHVDGRDFITSAIEAGAEAVFCEELPPTFAPHVVYYQVENARHTMSCLARRLYGHPSAELPVVGVTGTDGKSSTTWFIDQLLTHLEIESGFISTVLIKKLAGPEKNTYRQSTPEAPEIQEFLREMVDHGREVALVEATSHGLSDRTARLRGVDFHVAVLTNINHEHLEFHGSFEQYRSDKANLFRSLDRTAKRSSETSWPIFGVVNADDPNAYYFQHATRQPVLTYSLGNRKADLVATDLVATAGSTACVVHWRREARELVVPFPGSFNVENVLAAVLTVANLLDRNPLDVLDAAPLLKPLPGRMRIVSRETPYLPIVDYAHTPASYEKLLSLMRQQTENRLIVLFGSAGERDLAKRPMQGAIAARYADVVFLADEDPRGDDPISILEDIAAGCEEVDPTMRETGRLQIIPDRRTAIRTALTQALPGDTLLFLGKGHEGSIIYADRVQEWDEARVVEEEIRTTSAGSASAGRASS